ncbi:MAG: phosphoribosylanthranilate isomerase [Ignavibacteria bacterium]|nr:phosphoribosylanthranilate isomerase [Ignavibacteria bacterium]MBI3766279.1 phosphoribosylanthranilate isomerase [Ignavibacteriales bacterium]
MGVRVKICGITRSEDAIYSTHAGADALGFIFYERSPRYVSPTNAAKIIEALPSFITPVGVFVNERREMIEQVISQTRIRIVQMSGDEQPEDCLGYPVKVWKTFRIRNHEEIEKVRRYSISAAMLDGANSTQYGGSGTLADFAIAREIKNIHPLVLAGGLHPENVVGAIRSVEPYAIDVNSGVESAPGKKDHSKIALLFERLAQINQ